MSDIIMSAVLILVSGVWTYVGIFDLGLWIPGVSADSGFIPTVFGIVTLVCSIPMLIQSLKAYRTGERTAPVISPRKETIIAFVRKYCPVFFGIFGLLCLEYLGLIPMIALLILGWMRLMNHFSWPKSALIAFIVTVVIYLIFSVWLQIPFPGLIK